ncbi:MAG: hypothetical protein QOH56_2230 [Pseudonocardiales bacterium]|jgi:hypothetical protein|nr:hypothetical protein [Pseudonocardiales bacterium]
MRRTVAAAGMLLSAGLLLTGCSGTKKSADPSNTGSTSVSATATGLAGGDGEGSRSTIITTPTPKLSSSTGAKELDKPCPYADLDSMRDQEGDRTDRSVQLATNPVGCRYYFQYDHSVIITEITIERFATATEAFNAVVTAAKGHPEFVDDKSIGDFGSITIKLPLQGVSTWACIFSKGKLAITAHTRQTVVGQDARNVAKLIAPKVK